MNKKDRLKKAGVISGILCCVFVAGILIVTNFNDMVEYKETEMYQAVYIWTPYGAEGNPGAGASGFLEIFFINTSDANGYADNDSSDFESWAVANMPYKTPYGNADEFEWETESEKTFVILIRVRYNKTHAWETDHFNGADTDTQLTMTCTDWAVGSNINNVSGTRYESRNNTGEDFIWENFVWDNGGTGYQIADDSTWTIPEIYIEARF